MTLKSEVAEIRYEVAEQRSGELRLTFTTDDKTSLAAHVRDGRLSSNYCGHVTRFIDRLWCSWSAECAVR